jgi:hypothetical protein
MRKDVRISELQEETFRASAKAPEITYDYN